MLTRSFWVATTERVLVTFAVTLVSTLGIGAEALDISEIRWGQALGIAAGAAALSLGKCLVAGLGVGPKGSPSLVADPAAAGVPAAEDHPDPDGHVRKVARADLDPGPAPGAHRRPRDD